MLTLRAVSLVLFVALTTPVVGFSGVGDESFRISPSISEGSIEFGTGYNTITFSRPSHSAVRFRNNLEKRTSRKSRPAFQGLVYKITVLKTREEYQSAFSGGVSASASYMGVTVSASVKYLTQSSFTSLDTVLVVQVDAITDIKIAHNPVFKRKPQQFLNEGKYKQFVETYGTHYLHQYTLGGKMLLEMKFSSSSQQKKRELDIALGDIAFGDNALGDIALGDIALGDNALGDIALGVNASRVGVQADFSSKMKSLKSFQNMFPKYVKLFTTGSTTRPPQGEVAACIQYSLDYRENVLRHPAVRDVEYTSMGNIPGSHKVGEFKNYLSSLQDKTDTLVGISKDLREVENDAADMLSLKDAGLASFNYTVLDNIKVIQSWATAIRDNLKKQYKNISTNFMRKSEFDELIEKYGTRPEYLARSLHQIMEEGREIHGGRVTLKTNEKGDITGRYISTTVSQKNGIYARIRTPRLDVLGPVTLQLRKHVDKHRSIALDQIVLKENNHYIIKSADGKEVLCMRVSDKRIIWNWDDGGRYTWEAKCQWRIVRTTSAGRSPVLEYGDTIILYNRRYPAWVMGVDSGWNLEQSPADKVKKEWIVGSP